MADGFKGSGGRRRNDVAREGGATVSRESSCTAPADRSETMRGLGTFAQVLQYLVDEQRWPLDLPDDLVDDDLTAVTYDWDPDEMGIPAERLDDLKRFQQMRPLTASRPVRHRAHRRGHPQSGRPPQCDRHRPVDPGLRPPIPHPRQPQTPARVAWPRTAASAPVELSGLTDRVHRHDGERP